MNHNAHDLMDARRRDQADSLAPYRQQFFIPPGPDGNPSIYLCGNSLGLQPKKVGHYIQEVIEAWAQYGVEGHVHGKHPWMPYHEFLTASMAGVVGALPSEVVVMNSLTVNLHLLMASFYRPEGKRRKILIEYSPFPSDRYAVTSQILFHGGDPARDLIMLQPAPGSDEILAEDIEATIRQYGDEIALIMMGGVNYYTGQAFDLKTITRLGHQYGCVVGFDLAHAAGNLDLNLHEDGPDFAAWCSYKYLNGGPGALGGIFVHQRHENTFNLPRFTGWWGHDKKTRFTMPDEFVPMPGAEGWQLSNPPIFAMAAMRASLDLFQEVGMARLNQKSALLTNYLTDLIQAADIPAITLITPKDPSNRGCQISLRVKGADKALFNRITTAGVIADWREPDVIRVAPVPFYNSFEDVFNFVEILKTNCA